MKNLLLSRVSLAVCLVLSTFSAFGQAGLVISQLYGGGSNSSATYNADFVELFNPTSAAISTSGLSVQYASAAGNFTQALPLTSATILPGHYFLVQTIPAGTVGAALPTPDTTGTAPNLSGTAGKVALVNGTAPLMADTSCALILADTKILDFVGYGSTASCYPGSGSGTSYAPGPTNNASSLIRANPSANTGDNSKDFSVVTPPNPRNASFGAAAGTLSATGSSNPASITAGQMVTLTVAVTPGTSPTSTGIGVVADLTQIGGIQAQAFTSNGDGTYSFTTSVVTTASGVLTLPVTVTDAQARSASPTIALTVNQPVATVAIAVIQGRKSTTSLTVSPYAGQQVTTTGIVTAVLPSAFFIQSQNPDSDPLTPEGIQIFTGTGKVPAIAVVGNLVQVTGTVATYPAVTVSHTPATEITSPNVTLISTNQPLPLPITLTTAMLTPAGGLYQLTPYEGMRVAIPSLTTSSGTTGSVSNANESAELATSTGYFYAVITGTPRPFREPGIDLRDPAVPNLPANVAQFDDNPERILVDAVLTGGPSIELSTGTVLTGVTGVLDFTFSSDSFYDPSRLLLDPNYDRSQVTGGMTVQAVPLPAANEFTVASFNIERFYNTDPTDDLYYIPAGVGGSTAGKVGNSQAADLTTAAYTRRLQKLSLAVRNVLNSPDVVTLEEVENQNVATAIANQINSDAGVAGLYTGYSTDNSTYYTQDGTGISVGFLVKNTVDSLGVTQFGANEIFTPSTSTSPITLNDRPWLVLSAGVKRTGAKDYPVTVIANHMKALTGVNSPTSTSTRTKKELQAEDIAKYIQTLQAKGTHVISGGDFNAFEFSDGYTDTLATYTNVNVLPATQVVNPGVAGLVNPPLVDLAYTLPAQQRWSYQEDGSAQILDHMVVTPELVSAGAHFAYAHMNADFPQTAYNDATTPARNSDHDVAVGYFTVPAPVMTATLTPAFANFTSALSTPSAGQVFTLTNTGEGAITITSIIANGDFAASNSCGSTLAVGTACSINVVFTPTVAGNSIRTLTVVTSAGTYTSSLNGVSTASTNFLTNSIDFGTFLSNSQLTRTATLSNISSSGLTINSIVLTGPYTQTNNCGTSLVASSVCTIMITQAITSLGPQPGTLVVTTNGAPSVLTTTLTGIALQPPPVTSTGTLSFPPTTVNASSASQTVTLTNKSSSPAIITGQLSVPNGAPNFQITANTCSPTVPVPVNGSCSISVNFTPTAVGPVNSVLATFSGVPSLYSSLVILTGTGVAPALPTLSSSSLVFPATNVSTASAAQTISVINNSPITIPVSSIAVTGDYSQTNTCGTSIAAAGSCVISIVFKPTAGGTRAGTLTVATAGSAPATLLASLTGSGVVPNFTIGDASGSSTTSLTVVAGLSVGTTLTFAPVNGFTGTIAITCATPTGALPTGVLCAPPSAFTLGAAAVTQTVTFTTTARNVKSSGLSLTGAGKPTWALIGMLTLSGVLMSFAGRSRRLGRAAGLLTLLLALCMPSMGCGNSSTVVANPGGTPAGSYTFLVRATSGSVTNTETVTLNVQ